MRFAAGIKTVELLILVLIAPSTHILIKSCDTEYSLYDNIYDVEWKSDRNLGYAIKFSTPACLDDEGTIITRICSNGSWIPTEPPICSKIQNNFQCPENFLEYKNLCIFITEPVRWGQTCPFPGQVYHNLDEKLKIFGNVWLPIKRKVNYGPYQYALPGRKYGLEYKMKNSDSSEIGTYNFDCAAKINGTVIPTNCSNLFSQVCVYPYDHFLYSCPGNCIHGGLGSNKCFCKIFTKTNTSRNEICKNMASLQNLVVGYALRRFHTDDVCWIKSFLKITDRSILYPALNITGVSYHRDGDLKCSICTVDGAMYTKAQLLLTFDVHFRKLLLYVDAPESLFKADNEDPVFCFTDSTDLLIERVEIDELWDSDEYYRNNSSGTAAGIQRFQVFKISLENNPGRYWCEAFQYPNMTLVKSNVEIASKKVKGYEYSLRVTIRQICSNFLICDFSNHFYTNIAEILDDFLDAHVEEVRVMHIFNFDISGEEIDVLLHITSKNRHGILKDYNMLKEILAKLSSDINFGHPFEIGFFRSSEFCLPEMIISDKFSLNWALTSIGTNAVPVELCVDENGIPATRKCQGSFMTGAEWSTFEGNCKGNALTSTATKTLHSYAKSNITLMANNIKLILDTTHHLTSLDVYFVAKILSKISISSLNEVDLLINNIDNIMKINKHILEESQVLLNSTDEILNVLDNYLEYFAGNYTNQNNGVLLILKPNIIVQISWPFRNNVSGIALYGNNTESLENYHIEQLKSNTSLQQLTLTGNLEIASFIPEALLLNLFQNISSKEKKKITVVTGIFYNDSLFNPGEKNSFRKVGSKIISVSIPNQPSYLESPVPIIFRSLNNSRSENCSFWNYGKKSHNGSGYWSEMGGTQILEQNLRVCSFFHLTHFALLVVSEQVSVRDEVIVSYDIETEEKHDTILSIITATGCSLSLIGVMGIFVTAFLFKSWRSKVGTKILLQLCIALSLEIIVTHVAHISRLSNDACTIVGIILHYAVLSKFSWMLVTAVLQLIRFVKVIGPLPSHLILKAMLLGWGLPMIPVALVTVISVDSYTAGAQGFCYPKGFSFYAGVLLPMIFIVSANTAVFFKVMHNVIFPKIESNSKSNNLISKQIYLAILLLFLLGVPWIFGILAEMIKYGSLLQHVFMYLFCLTATIQGLVLFLFYVLFDKNTRMLWYYTIYGGK